MKGDEQGNKEQDRSNLDAAGEIAVKRHFLHLSDQPVQKIGGKLLHQQPSLRCGKRSAQKDKESIKKDLPEGAHAGKATNFSEKGHTVVNKNHALHHNYFL